MAVRAQRRLQLGRVPPPGDQVRIGVLLAPPRPEEVVEQSRDGSPAEHLPDHRRRRRTFSAAASRRSARRMLSAAYGRRSAERWPGGVQLRHRLVQVDADPPDQPGRTDQLGQRLAERGVRRVHQPARGGQASPWPRTRPSPSRPAQRRCPALRTPRRSGRTARCAPARCSDGTAAVTSPVPRRPVVRAGCVASPVSAPLRVIHCRPFPFRTPPCHSLALSSWPMTASMHRQTAPGLHLSCRCGISCFVSCYGRPYFR